MGALLVLAGCQNTVSGQSVSPSRGGGSASQGTVEFREVVGSPDAGTPSGPPSAPPPTAPPSRFSHGVAQPTLSSAPSSTSSGAGRQDVNVDDPASVEAALAALDCGAPQRDRVDPARPLVACDNQSVKYALKPAFLTGAEVAKAQAEVDTQSGRWIIQLSFTSNGSKTWGDFTAAHVGSQVAVVLDGKVVSAPEIQEAILGGNTQISGNFTREQAEDLAARLTSR